MLYHLCMTWVDVIGPLRVFRYPSFRIPAAALTALVLMLVFFPRFIVCVVALRTSTAHRSLLPVVSFKGPDKTVQ